MSTGGEGVRFCAVHSRKTGSACVTHQVYPVSGSVIAPAIKAVHSGVHAMRLSRHERNTR